MAYGSMRSPWLLVVWVLGGLMLLLGISVISASVTFSDAPFTITLSLLLGGWLCFLAPFSCVRITENGIKYRGLLRYWTLAWSEVDSVDVGLPREGNLLTSVVPVVKKKNGKVLELAVLSGYAATGGSNRRVMAQVDRIRQVLSGVR